MANDDVHNTLVAAAHRYRPLGRMAAGWAKGKLLGDPVYAAVLEALPASGRVLDVGCGEGYLLCAIRTAAPALELNGIDHDVRRVRLAHRALADQSDVCLVTGDIRTSVFHRADLVTLLDVLHYMPVVDQDDVLLRAAAALLPGGTLIVRDVEPGRGVRSMMAIGAERLARIVGRHRGDGLHYRPSDETASVLRASGLQVDASRCDQGTPFANQLLIASKFG